MNVPVPGGLCDGLRLRLAVEHDLEAILAVKQRLRVGFEAYAPPIFGDSGGTSTSP